MICKSSKTEEEYERVKKVGDLVALAEHQLLDVVAVLRKHSVVSGRISSDVAVTHSVHFLHLHQYAIHWY